jgi:hypothetical protein
MSSFADRLPDRFPVGTRYVIEGRGGGEGRLRIHRYLEFPMGAGVELLPIWRRNAGAIASARPPPHFENNFAGRNPMSLGR